MRTSKEIQWILPVLLIIGLGACDPQVSSAPDLKPAPHSDNVTFEVTPDAANPNIIQFENTSEGSFKALWDLGNGQTADGDIVLGEYPLEGEYTVVLTIFTESGQALNSKTVTIAETNVSMLDDPNLNMLTGGADDIDGKTWVIDSTKIGHMGVGPLEGDWPEWWQAPPEAKTGAGLYNDRYTFQLSDGFVYNMETNGDVFLNGAYGDEFENTTVPPDGADLMAPWTAPANQSFSLIEEENGDLFLKVADPTFIGFYAGARTYQIQELTENVMRIRYEDPKNGIAWYHRLIQEGYEHPIVPLPYKSEELADNFDDEGNVDWGTDQIASFVEGYDNPAPIGVNTSAKVAKYEKGSAFYDNVYIDLGYELNLNERSIVRLKAYLPSYNDYETVASNKESWASGILAQQVEVKLHNVDGATGLGGNSWQTQATVIQPVAETDTWVELEFVFSGVSDREDFDRIIIQIGGEGHGNPGIFFIDDFQLTSQ
ncbi:MAG: PKD domain-containing protein [Gracilimonas sp.]|uniref:PKD domain-containing protein n=1 Tax=Gracilimonas sp. TaxID=1974203 RepID=UPI0019A7F9AB|nr:PKD domain-containing protein [Gracilimonas sp.]MBD3616815.1 PKD domain-containing protein [Gracilimonas sp.]